MRMMMKIVLPTVAYNQAIARGELGPTWKKVFGVSQPEAVYYVTEQGRRAVYAFLEVDAAHQLAALTLPLYEVFEAEVSLAPAMVFADLAAGMKTLG